jgi:hypothetical protein
MMARKPAMAMKYLVVCFAVAQSAQSRERPSRRVGARAQDSHAEGQPGDVPCRRRARRFCPRRRARRAAMPQPTTTADVGACAILYDSHRCATAPLPRVCNANTANVSYAPPSLSIREGRRAPWAQPPAWAWRERAPPPRWRPPRPRSPEACAVACAATVSIY